MATYKAVMRPALEYSSSIWSTSINNLQVMQNAALRTAIGWTQDTNIQHMHDDTHTSHTRALTAPRVTLQAQHPSQKQTCAIAIHLLSLYIKPQEAITKYCKHLHHTLAALKRYFPASVIAPLPNSLCPLCKTHTHDTHDLFNCTHICTTLSPPDLWTDPAGVTALLAHNLEYPPLTRVMGEGRQHQQQGVRFWWTWTQVEMRNYLGFSHNLIYY